MFHVIDFLLVLILVIHPVEAFDTGDGLALMIGLILGKYIFKHILIKLYDYYLISCHEVCP